MAPSRSQTSLFSLLAVTALLPSPVWAFDCKDVMADRQHFDLSKLAGPHVVHWKEEDPAHDMRYKYNFTLDICDKLKWHKGGSLATECHHGARVCGLREDINLAVDRNATITPIDIAGTFTSLSGRVIDAKFELLRNPKSNSDSGREGVRAFLNGGRHPFTKDGLNQRAIIEFVCDKEKTGLEGDEKDDGEREDGDKDDGDDDKKEEKLRRRDDAGKGKCEDTENSLRFCGYQQEDEGKDKKVQTLRLEWKTKYACEDAPSVDGGSHWGFFGWFFIILFLAIATYLIFGSWLNYNRYGARGWDLLPHGDAIRDIPYIAKDFARKVAGTVQGGGSRGGYAAV
ncbi:autophagy-related protein 27 [Paraphoma chrysanthemicola]|uniref:Autophagy-related protein 27 n=1 Tax=Paraphoma chrysanthemicola TaxID=798071 RepID=A0A8K0VTD5_9PLEO|nr:autophagy-related protein 27 [Paraphoma chrysanthemicola]